MRKRHWRRTGWVAALASVLLIAACGNPDDAAKKPAPSEKAHPSPAADVPSEPLTPADNAHEKVVDSFIQQASALGPVETDAGIV